MTPITRAAHEVSGRRGPAASRLLRARLFRLSIPEDHIRRDAEAVEVPAGAEKARLGSEAELPEVVDLHPATQGQRQIVLAGDRSRAEVEHVSAFEVELASAAVERI